MVSTIRSFGSTLVTNSVQREPSIACPSLLGISPTWSGKVRRQAEGMPRVSSSPPRRTTERTWMIGTPSLRAASWKVSIGATMSRARGAGHGQSGECIEMAAMHIDRHDRGLSGIEIVLKTVPAYPAPRHRHKCASHPPDIARLATCPVAGSVAGLDPPRKPIRSGAKRSLSPRRRSLRPCRRNRRSRRCGTGTLPVPHSATGRRR